MSRDPNRTQCPPSCGCQTWESREWIKFHAALATLLADPGSLPHHFNTLGHVALVATRALASGIDPILFSKNFITLLAKDSNFESVLGRTIYGDVRRIKIGVDPLFSNLSEFSQHELHLLRMILSVLFEYQKTYPLPSPSTPSASPSTQNSLERLTAFVFTLPTKCEFILRNAFHDIAGARERTIRRSHHTDSPLTSPTSEVKASPMSMFSTPGFPAPRAHLFLPFLELPPSLFWQQQVGFAAAPAPRGQHLRSTAFSSPPSSVLIPKARRLPKEGWSDIEPSPDGFPLRRCSLNHSDGSVFAPLSKRPRTNGAEGDLPFRQ